MRNLDKQKKLAEEAVELIKEFREQLAQFGENLLNDIKIVEGGKLIIIEDKYAGEIECELSEISEVFESEMEGCAPGGGALSDDFDLMKSEVADEYKRLNKKEFIEYVGSIYYAECRCEEIYERLKQIEDEAEELDII